VTTTALTLSSFSWSGQATSKGKLKQDRIEQEMETPVRILIVDDDPLVLGSTALTLERAGYTVDSTADVFGLPLRVGRFRPHAILLDVNLPATSGDQIALSLGRLRAMSGCKVIFHSAASEESLADTTAARGAAGYIPKGLPRREFLRQLGEILAASPAPEPPG
jgi:DNA-binding response OmpR family regulator